VAIRIFSGRTHLSAESYGDFPSVFSRPRKRAASRRNHWKIGENRQNFGKNGYAILQNFGFLSRKACKLKPGNNPIQLA
jgi:hypothetical protein